MADAIFIEGGILVPADAVEMRAVRASGPGGQNVNKVASKVELRVDLDRVQGLNDEARRRLRQLVAKRLDDSGRLVVTSQRTRDQYRNLVDARRKVHDWIAKATVAPKKRRKSEPPAQSRERRLSAKHRHAMRKLSRRAVNSQEEL
jgi:ribosome-associated protein